MAVGWTVELRLGAMSEDIENCSFGDKVGELVGERRKCAA